jgi:hypothetical protein
MQYLFKKVLLKPLVNKLLRLNLYKQDFYRNKKVMLLGASWQKCNPSVKLRLQFLREIAKKSLPYIFQHQSEAFQSPSLHTINSI